MTSQETELEDFMLDKSKYRAIRGGERGAKGAQAVFDGVVCGAINPLK